MINSDSVSSVVDKLGTGVGDGAGVSTGGAKEAVMSRKC